MSLIKPLLWGLIADSESAYITPLLKCRRVRR